MQKQCVDICIKISPYTPDLEFSPIAEYDNISYTQSIYMNLYTKKIYHMDKTCDIDVTCDFHEIVSYIKTQEFAKKYKVHDKAGILFLHNGYPIIGFRNHSLNCSQYYITIDINNYVFNKKIISELRKLEKKQKKNDMYYEVGLVLGVIAIALITIIFIGSTLEV